MMEKRKTYTQPSCLVIPLGLHLNNSWGDNEGFVGIGSGAINANFGQSKDTDIPDDDANTLWED